MPEGKVIDKMRLDVKPNGEKSSVLQQEFQFFFSMLFAMQCASTVAVVYRETKS